MLHVFWKSSIALGPGGNISASCAAFKRQNNGKAESIVIGNICYAYSGNSANTFDDGYNRCNGDKIVGFNSIVGFEYGRLAAFETPAIYMCVAEQLRLWASSNKVFIGAHNKGQGGGALTEYVWARTTGTDDGCQIFSTEPTGATVTPYNPTGTNWAVLVVDPMNPYSFWAYNQNASSLSTYYLCEYGKEVWRRLRALKHTSLV